MSDRKNKKHADFAERFARLMDGQGIPSKAIQEELGVSDEAVRLWRAGDRMPTHDNLKELAKMLGVSVSLLRDGDAAASELAPGAIVVTNDDERQLIVTYRELKPWAQEALRKRAAQLLEDFTPKGPANPFGKKTNSAN